MSTEQESAHSTGKKVKGFFFFECACFDEGRHSGLFRLHFLSCVICFLGEKTEDDHSEFFMPDVISYFLSFIKVPLGKLRN